MGTGISFTFGTDYYPEHWPENRWERDADMMKDFGIEVVRLAEFSWFKMEPEEGKFCFEWLEKAIDILAKRGIKVILGTPTAAPPAWMVREDPEILPTDENRRLRGFGGRHHDCQSNPHYREHIRRFVTAYVSRFKDHPAVIGWQIDNELGNSHGDLCHCKYCASRFQGWLKNKYVNIDALNARWGTAFWSQGYRSFEEIGTPALTVTGVNPTQALDWKRFSSDLVLEFHDFQADIIRKLAPGHFITHNCMGFADKISYFDLGEKLDFMSHDQYPGGFFISEEQRNEPRDARQAAELAVIRSAKDRSFAIMEQQSSITGWQIMGNAPRPGQLALWSLQSIAQGADAIVYFRWRSCLMGTEQYWHGLLPHSGIPGRNYDELKQFVSVMKPLLPEIRGAMPPRAAGILFSYDEEYAISIQPHHPGMSYVDHLMPYYKALHDKNVPVDIVPYDREWTGYKLLIAPLYYLTWPEINIRMKRFVQNGGILVLDMRAGVKDGDNLCIPDQALPAGLSELTGFVVEEYDCLLNGGATIVWDGVTYPAEKWCDIGFVTTAEPLAVYASEFYKGRPAITRNKVRRGQVYYVGTELCEGLAGRLAEELCGAAGLEGILKTETGVEVTVRDRDRNRFVFVLNHNGTEKQTVIPAGWELLTGGTPGILPAYGYQVFKTARP